MSTYKSIVKDLLTNYTSSIRCKIKVSQDKMSELLHITPRAYSYLETGKYCLSAQSLLFLMNLMEEKEIKHLLLDFRELICEVENKDAV